MYEYELAGFKTPEDVMEFITDGGVIADMHLNDCLSVISERLIFKLHDVGVGWEFTTESRNFWRPLCTLYQGNMFNLINWVIEETTRIECLTGKSPTQLFIDQRVYSKGTSHLYPCGTQLIGKIELNGLEVIFTWGRPDFIRVV